MTGCAWVPPGAQSSALDADLAAMAGDWGEAWFGRPLAVRDAASGDGAMTALGDAVAVTLTGDSLGALALGSRFAGTRSAADRALLDRVGDAARDDLYRRVGAALGLSGNDWNGPVERLAWTPARSMRFADPAGRLRLTLHLGEACLAAATLARLPAVSSSARPLTPLSRAVAGRAVRLSARLGRCTLRVAEMRDMVVGDTLLFDAQVDDALPVVIDDAAAGIATARVVREAAHWTLKVDTSRMGKAA
ncbi:MAG: FliM/FliN family flagellar motor C-terminal domain-containing protein [Sphingomonas paucimobilis]